MEHHYRWRRPTYLSPHWSTKLEKISDKVTGVNWNPESKTLNVQDYVAFITTVQQHLRISERCFEKQMKMYGFRKKLREDSIQYVWRGRKRFSISKQINGLTGLIKSQEEHRRKLLEDIASKKKAIDDLLQDSIFRLLVRGCNNREDQDELRRCVEMVQQSINDITNRTVESTEGLQVLYAQELKTFKKLVTNDQD